MLSVADWLVWAIDIFLAASWTYGIRLATRQGESVSIPTAIQTLFFWIIAIVFFLTDHSKLHILWVVPLCFLTSLLVTFVRVPILGPLIRWMTGLFLVLALAGVKRSALETVSVPPIDPECPAVVQFAEMWMLSDPVVAAENDSGRLSAASTEVLNAFKLKHRKECSRCAKYAG